MCGLQLCLFLLGFTVCLCFDVIIVCEFGVLIVL